ncbi:hypothetical protein [Marinifilum flexuosum]|uniref:hypothetical protein n=1 Tax=Marinifilum flexuosum TaxID=1117708 RepID=UPI00248F784F|nr:hypothetical protein [Marinifilum flexuosum]
MNKDRILILADFTEGNACAIDFSLKYLCSENSKIYLMQTWQKPSFGSSMLRDIAPILKDISNGELNALKNKVLKEYQLQDDRVELLSFEGDLLNFFKSDVYRNENWQVVLSLKEDSSDLQFNPRFKEIVEASNQTLYILNHCNPGEQINQIYVRNDKATISTPILGSLQKICSEQKCNVLVDLDSNHITSDEKAKMMKRFENACENASVKTKNRSENGQETPGSKSLSIYHIDQSVKKKSDLLSYFDKWFVKSKGITVRNF